MADDIQAVVDRLAEDRLPELVREDALGELNFREAMPELRVIRKVLNGYLQQPTIELPDTLPGQVAQQTTQVSELLDRMESFTLAQDQSATQHKQIIDGIKSQRRWVVEQVRPHIRSGEVDTAGQRQELAEVVQSAKSDAEIIGQLLSTARQQAGDAGAQVLSRHYGAAAVRHQDNAKLYRTLVGVALGVTFVGILVLFLWFPPQLDGASDASTSVLWGEFVRQLVYRLLLLGVLSYALSFLVRNYRSERHLQVLNEAKKSALDTFTLFQDATADDATRALILAELVRAVFVAPETGMVADARDRAILETAPGLQGLLAGRFE